MFSLSDKYIENTVTEPHQTLEGIELRYYQKEIIAWMEYRELLFDQTMPKTITNGYFGIRGGIVVAEMGLGKTLMGLTLIIRSNTRPNLIVCDKTLLSHWRDEVVKFFGNSISVLVFHKDYLKDINNYTCIDLCNYDIVITTYETVSGANPKEEFQVYNNIQKHGKYSFELSIFGDECTFQQSRVFGMREREFITNNPNIKGKEALLNTLWNKVICDESQKFKNPSTHTFKSMMCLSSLYKWCLTGTPFNNKAKDIWSQLTFLGYLGTQEHNNWDIDVFRKYELKEAMCIVTRENVGIEMPNLIENIEMLEFNEHEQYMYDMLTRDLLDMYEKAKAKKKKFACVLERLGRLRQTSISPYLIRSLFDRDEASYLYDIDAAGTNSTKHQRVISLIQENPDDKFIIFSNFKEPASLIARRLYGHSYRIINGDTKINDRNQFIDDFNNDDLVKILFLSYKVGSNGLNLQIANQVILLEPWWNPFVHDQAIARAYRPGQKNDVTVTYLLMKNSVEGKILEICNDKRDKATEYLGDDYEIKTKSSSGITMKNIADMLGIVF